MSVDLTGRRSVTLNEAHYGAHRRGLISNCDSSSRGTAAMF
jgi:hypothetical protein